MLFGASGDGGGGGCMRRGEAGLCTGLVGWLAGWLMHMV